MKKSLVITGAASLALAAMPVLGAFADVTDTVQITIPSACSVASDSGETTPGATNSMTSNMTNNDVKEFSAAQDAAGAGGDIYVTCNASGGWNITAVGFSSDTEGNTDMVVTTGTGTAIPTNASPAAGTSAWAYKIVDTGSTGATIVPTTWSVIPNQAGVVVSKSGAISEGHISTNYKVSTSATQEAATYTGKVKYVVSSGLGL